MPSLFVIFRGKAAERKYLGIYAGVFLSATIFAVEERSADNAPSPEDDIPITTHHQIAA